MRGEEALLASASLEPYADIAKGVTGTITVGVDPDATNTGTDG
ncbi:hypothetical protein [Streptomyces torulosus]|nr:hypothetical protein [Streptomyces torulosus]